VAGGSCPEAGRLCNGQSTAVFAAAKQGHNCTVDQAPGSKVPTCSRLGLTSCSEPTVCLITPRARRDGAVSSGPGMVGYSSPSTWETDGLGLVYLRVFSSHLEETGLLGGRLQCLPLPADSFLAGVQAALQQNYTEQFLDFAPDF
jgi:hypothetical protein